MYFAGGTSDAELAQTESSVQDALAPEAETGEGKAVFDVKDLDYQSIWSTVKAATGARDVPPTKEEIEEIRKWEHMKVESEKNRQRNAVIRQKQKDQELMLKKAREDVEALRQR